MNRSFVPAVVLVFSLLLSSVIGASPYINRPVFTGGLAVTAHVGQRLKHQVLTDTPAEFAAIGLPPEFVINLHSGVITGVPLVPRQAHVTICARNAAGMTKADLNLIITK